MIVKLKSVLKTIFPAIVIEKLKNLHNNILLLSFKIKIQHTHNQYKKVLLKVKEKHKIKVAFFLMHHADWKYEVLYRLMDNDERFDPIVIVCPYSVYGEEFMVYIMNKSFESFKK